MSDTFVLVTFQRSGDNISVSEAMSVIEAHACKPRLWGWGSKTLSLRSVWASSETLCQRRKINISPVTGLWYRKPYAHLLYKDTSYWGRAFSPGQILTPVCDHGLLTLTFFNKIRGELFGCSVRALELQEAPGEQAALHRPEQGEEHRANLPMGPAEHQQLTLQESKLYRQDYSENTVRDLYQSNNYWKTKHFAHGE